MVIVSQDKEHVINFDYVKEIRFIGPSNSLKVDIFDNYEVTLGVYNTKERAKEVLQEITFAYANMKMLEIPKIKIHQTIPAAEMVRNICYKMPED